METAEGNMCPGIVFTQPVSMTCDERVSTADNWVYGKVKHYWVKSASSNTTKPYAYQ